MGKNKNVPASAVAGSSRSNSGSEPIDNLKTLHTNLLKEVLESQKHIEDLRFQHASFADERGIAHSIDRDVFRLVISSSLQEATALNTPKIVAAKEKAETAAAELNAAEMRLLDLVKEKEAVQRDLKRILEERNSSLRALEKAEKTRKKKRWMAATAFIFASTAIVTLCCCKSSKVQN